MHELAIAQALIELATAEAERAGARRITRLNCRIGVLRQLQGDLLSDAFEIARCDTPCAEAALHVEPVPLRAECPACGETFAVEGWDWACPTCGGDGRLIDAGDELSLESIEVDLGAAEAEPIEAEVDP